MRQIVGPFMMSVKNVEQKQKCLEKVSFVDAPGHEILMQVMLSDLTYGWCIDAYY